MDLFSLYKCSSLEVVFSRKLLVVAYLLLSGAVLYHLVSATLQLVQAYLSLHQFDTPASIVDAITLCLFLPFWGTGALLLRACLQRLRLELWVRRAVRVAQYTTSLSPAEAGFLTCYGFNRRELVATLLDLHFRGAISLSITPGEHLIRLTEGPAPGVQLTDYERSLLQALARLEQPFITFADPRLNEVALQAHRVLVDSLTSRGLIQREHLPTPGLRQFFRVIYLVAGSVGLISTYAYIFQRATVEAIGWPRYPMQPSELVLLALVELSIAVIILSSYWPRFTRDYHDPRYEAWVDAAGFQLYLGTVYRNRLSDRTIAEEDPQTLSTVTPFAMAFGLMPPRSELIGQVLTATSSPTTAPAPAPSR